VVTHRREPVYRCRAFLEEWHVGTAGHRCHVNLEPIQRLFSREEATLPLRTAPAQARDEVQHPDGRFHVTEIATGLVRSSVSRYWLERGGVG
jgi:hypothetical protein